MRVKVDRTAEGIHLVLTETPEARRVVIADDLTLAYDAAGRIVGVVLRSVDPAALHDFTVELAGLPDRPAGAAAPPVRAAPALSPRPEPYGGPLTWDAEAEAAMLQVPFFSRGRIRLAASALARERGQERVTLALVQAVGR